MICERRGLGIQAGLNPVVVRGGSGRLCSGQSTSSGVFWSLGAGLMLSGSVSASNGGITAGRGWSFGLGGGLAAGTQQCTVTLICFNDDPCACGR